MRKINDTFILIWITLSLWCWGHPLLWEHFSQGTCFSSSSCILGSVLGLFTCSCLPRRPHRLTGLSVVTYVLLNPKFIVPILSLSSSRVLSLAIRHFQWNIWKILKLNSLSPLSLLPESSYPPHYHHFSIWTVFWTSPSSYVNYSNKAWD